MRTVSAKCVQRTQLNCDGLMNMMRAYKFSNITVHLIRNPFAGAFDEFDKCVFFFRLADLKLRTLNTFGCVAHSVVDVWP